MYLPQYHEIEENSKFWGEGFTDWVGVRNSRPLYNSHKQPRVPLNNNYYDLSKVENIRWQCKLARESGIDGFGIYHYWFNENQNLLDTPPKLILDNDDIDISFFFAWDNTSWVRSWSRIRGNDWFPNGEKNQKTTSPQVLIQYDLGREPQWKKHFDWLIPFFKDSRYEKYENKPLFMILNPSQEIMKMAEYWQQLAKENGFDGIHIIYRWDAVRVKDNHLIKNEYAFMYEPSTSGWSRFIPRVLNRISRSIGIAGLKKYNYDKIWKQILCYAKKNVNKKMLYCAFVDYDDTPRRGVNGKVIEGMTIEKFYTYLKKLYSLSNKQGKKYMFITAWNEWGEGAYLEPDKDNKYALLDVVKRIVQG